jgi:hypothetical protein
MDKSSSLGCPCHSKKYPRSTSVKAWGCPRHPLLHQQKYQVIFHDTIFLLLHMLCVVIGASLFLFLVFFCLVSCNKWLDPNIFFGEDTLRFYCLEHSSFLLLVLHLAFVFRLYFCLELVSYL